jgi:hypothetical protein
MVCPETAVRRVRLAAARQAEQNMYSGPTITEKGLVMSVSGGGG